MRQIFLKGYFCLGLFSDIIFFGRQNIKEFFFKYVYDFFMQGYFYLVSCSDIIFFIGRKCKRIFFFNIYNLFTKNYNLYIFLKIIFTWR